jgi:sec-independent protein translocase protein TatC
MTQETNGARDILEENKDKKAAFTTHLEELRKRLLKSVIAVAITTCISFFFTQQVFGILKSPAPGIDLIFIEVTEMIGTYLKIAFLCGIVLALPFLFYQLIMFIAPALTAREERYLYLLSLGVPLLFIGGAAFAYFVLLPPALTFLIYPPFATGIAEPHIRVANYISVVTSLIFWIGLTFQFPLVMGVLAKIGVLTHEQFSGYRRHAIVGAFILAAIITPTFDPVNQTVVAFPIIILYEVGIWMAKFAGQRKTMPKVVNRV